MVPLAGAGCPLRPGDQAFALHLLLQNPEGLIDIVVFDEYLHLNSPCLNGAADCRSAELLFDQRPQLTASEKAGRRLPVLGSAADSLFALMRARRRDRSGYFWVVQKKSLASLCRRHHLFVGLPIAQPSMARIADVSASHSQAINGSGFYFDRSHRAKVGVAGHFCNRLAGYHPMKSLIRDYRRYPLFKLARYRIPAFSSNLLKYGLFQREQSKMRMQRIHFMSGKRQ